MRAAACHTSGSATCAAARASAMSGGDAAITAMRLLHTAGATVSPVDSSRRAASTCSGNAAAAGVRAGMTCGAAMSDTMGGATGQRAMSR